MHALETGSVFALVCVLLPRTHTLWPKVNKRSNRKQDLCTLLYKFWTKDDPNEVISCSVGGTYLRLCKKTSRLIKSPDEWKITTYSNSYTDWVATSISGAVSGFIILPKNTSTCRPGNWTSDLLITRCWLYTWPTAVQYWPILIKRTFFFFYFIITYNCYNSY